MAKAERKIAAAIAGTVEASPQKIKLLRPLHRRAGREPTRPRASIMAARTATAMATAPHAATTAVGMSGGRTGQRTGRQASAPIMGRARRAAATNTGARTAGTSVARSGVNPGR